MGIAEPLETFQSHVSSTLKKVKLIEEQLKNSEEELSETIGDLKTRRKHLHSQVTTILESLSRSKLCTLEQLLNGKLNSTALSNRKKLFEEFLFLYIDSTQNPRLIHPIQFTAYKINKPKDWEQGLYEEYTEEELTEYFDKLIVTTGNWIATFSDASLFSKLVENNIAVAHAFRFTDKTRKVHFKFKVDKTSVFVRESFEDAKTADQLFEARDELMEVNEYFLSKKMDDEEDD